MAFEEELKTLIERTKKNGTDTSYKESYEAINSNFYDVKKQHEIWMNDVEIFFNKYLKEHVLAPKIESWLFHRKYNQLVAALESICNDKNYIDKMNPNTRRTGNWHINSGSAKVSSKFVARI